MAFDPTLVRSWPRGNVNIACKLFKNGVQSIPTGIETPITAYTSELNAVGAGDMTTGRFIWPEPGIYVVNVSGQWAANATGYRQIIARSISVGAESSVWPNIGAGAVTIQTVTCIYFVTAAHIAAARFLELGAFHTAGVNLNFDQAILEVCKISDWAPV